MEINFILEKYNGLASRYTCPNCGKPRCFSRYLNTQTGEYLADNVGRCNRESKCGYHYKPKDYFYDNPQSAKHGNFARRNMAQNFASHTHSQRIAEAEKPSYIPDSYLKTSILHSEEHGNNLLDYLKKVVGLRYTDCVKHYHIGSAKKWTRSTVFWQVDVSGRVRSGKIILYDSSSGKRVKSPYNHITWVHSELKRKGLISDDFNFSQCLFGEHQLNQHPGKAVAVVESEKTAILASAYLPEFIWLACGGLNGINPVRFDPLKNRSVILYPDINGFEKWSEKANTLKTLGFRISVSDLLENADFVTNEERANGFDLGDYLPRIPIPLSPLESMINRNPEIENLIRRLDLIQP